MSNKLVKPKHQIIKMVLGNKVWQISRQMVNATIEIAKQKYVKQGVNAIVAVEKDNMVVMLKDVFEKENTEAFEKAINDWQLGGYKCYYTK